MCQFYYFRFFIIISLSSPKYTTLFRSAIYIYLFTSDACIMFFSAFCFRFDTILCVNRMCWNSFNAIYSQIFANFIRVFHFSMAYNVQFDSVILIMLTLENCWKMWQMLFKQQLHICLADTVNYGFCRAASYICIMSLPIHEESVMKHDN